MWKRAVNERFSGGDKKRNEIFQLVVLQPRLAILDETDSGLDVDALRIVADGVNSLRSDERAFVVVIHYQRLLNYITVDWIVGQSSSLALFRTSMLNTNAMPDASCTGSPGPADKPEVRRDGYGTVFAIDM